MAENIQSYDKKEYLFSWKALLANIFWFGPMKIRETWTDYQNWRDNPETQATLGRRHRKKPTTQKIKGWAPRVVSDLRQVHGFLIYSGSSTYKTDLHDISKILLKEMFNNIILNLTLFSFRFLYEIFYDRTRKRWPFNTDDCLI
jgi:hypothetical protein